MRNKFVKIAERLIKIAEELMSVSVRKDNLTKFNTDKVIVKPNEIKVYERNTLAYRIRKIDENTYEAKDYISKDTYYPLDMMTAFAMSQYFGIDRSYFEEAFGKLPEREEVSLERFVNWFYEKFFRLDDILISTIRRLEDSTVDYLEDLITDEGLPFDEELLRGIVSDTIGEELELIYPFDDKVIFTEIIEPFFKEYIEFDASRNLVIIPDFSEFLSFIGREYDWMLEELYVSVEEFLIEQFKFTIDDLLNKYKEAIKDKEEVSYER